MDWLASEGIGIAQVHAHVLVLQKRFLDGLARSRPGPLLPERLVPAPEAPRGNFLAFDVDDAHELHRRIAAQSVTIDRRGRILRFGFGIYHDAGDVDRLLVVLARALR